MPDEKQEKAIKNSLLEENPDSIEANFAAAENYLMNGMFAEAEPHLMKALAIDEEKAYIHNHLGVVYFHQDNNGKAEQHFKRALQIEPDMIESYFNLGMLYQKQGRFKDGLPYYKAVVNYEPDNAEAFYLMGQCAMCSDMIQEAKAFFAESFRLSPTPRTAMDLVILLISQEEYPEAERVLEFLINIEEAHEAITKAKELSPDDTGIQENYQLIFQIEDKKEVTVVESGQDKIAFFCGPDDNFLNGIMAHLSQKYEVKRFQGGTVQDMHDLMKWSSVSWFEWCDNFITHASKLPKVCKTICRLHSYEAFTDVIRQINWKTVDDLVFVAPHIRDIVTKQLPNLSQDVNIHVIFNGVDLEKYSFKDRQKGFNIAYVGYINHKKNPALLLQCIKYLVDIDDRYVLHVAGKHQELRFQLYFEHIIKEMELEKNVVFHGWIDDVNGWLEDKHFTVSTSVLESFCHGIADAMACGLKPLIHNFIGAKELYPQKYIFNSVKDFSDMVINDDYNPAEYRKYIKDNYSQDKQLNEIENLLESVSK